MRSYSICKIIIYDVSKRRLNHLRSKHFASRGSSVVCSSLSCRIHEGLSNYQLTLCFVWMKTSRKTDSGIINPIFSLTEHAYCEQWFYNVCACCGWKHPWRLIWEFLSLRSLSLKEAQFSAIESFIVAVGACVSEEKRTSRRQTATEIFLFSFQWCRSWSLLACCCCRRSGFSPPYRPSTCPESHPKTLRRCSSVSMHCAVTFARSLFFHTTSLSFFPFFLSF